LVGRGLVQAVENFTLHAEWQDSIKKRVENKIAEVGQEATRTKLEEYLPRVNEDIETSNDAEREKMLRKLLSSLKAYIRDLAPRNV